jgi:pyruvate/2-oxoglutarate dehydrogenase complex dihydrolipoamide acyltransferase (E2) component
MNSTEKSFGRRQSDSVLIQLTEKIVENNNSVSSVVNLMSENLSQLVEAQERIEDKIDDYEDTQDIIKNMAKHIEVIKKTTEDNQVILKSLDDSGILKLVTTIKRALIGIVIAMFTGLIFLIIRELLFFYVKHGAPLIQ